jgi:hypothetical protein
MIIRQEQMAVLTDRANQLYRREVAAYLRRNLPIQTSSLDDQQLDERIAGWQSRAARYNVVTERAVAKWCYLALVTGDKFDEQPAIREYLSQSRPEPSMKMDNLMDALYIRLRQAEPRTK